MKLSHLCLSTLWLLLGMSVTALAQGSNVAVDAGQGGTSKPRTVAGW